MPEYPLQSVYQVTPQEKLINEFEKQSVSDLSATRKSLSSVRVARSIDLATTCHNVLP